MEILDKPVIPNYLREKLQLYFGISLGIFLFFLFFEPLGNIHSEDNNKLLFYAGIGGITFIFLWLFRTAIPWLFPKTSSFVILNISSDLIFYAFIWIFNSVAFVFFIRYVGPLHLTMFMVFKIVLLGLLPVVVLRINSELNSLKKMTSDLMEKNNKLQMQLANTNSSPYEIFNSENKSEVLKLAIDDIVFIKSADNYVEIFYRDKNIICQKLIRNTLKNVEGQLKKYSLFIRCHRAYIVNKNFVQDFRRNYAGHCLKLSGYNEEIPVSRQYLISIKEAITMV